MPRSIATLTSEPWGYEFQHVDTLALASVRSHLAIVRENEKNPLSRYLTKLLKRIRRISVPACLRRRQSAPTEYQQATNEMPKLTRVRRNPSPAPAELSAHTAYQQVVDELPELTRVQRVPSPSPSASELRSKRNELKRVDHNERVLLHDEFSSPA